ncbi:MAG: hypothetical protein PHN88_04620 [Ignavibacteria bacterium]|nr:hypothetical protein [Ignavibacteria bacterium]
MLFVCNKIADKVRGDEFSIVTNIKEKEDNTLTLSDEYYIPKQKVAKTSIEYLPDHYSFNTVIHRHPDGMNTFSSTDKSFINQNFELSILFTREDGFVNGVFNLKHDDYLIQIPVEIYIDYGMENIDISNIEQESLITTFGRKKERPDEWRSGKTASDERDIFSEAIDRPVEKLFPEESLDYDLLRTYMLDEVNESIENLDYRVTNIEDSLSYGGASMASNEHPF